MTDANEDRMHMESIKNRCKPMKFNTQTMAVLEGLVQVCSGVHNSATLPELTRKLVEEAYKELIGRSMDDRCFDDDKTFIRSLTTQVEMKAREYKEQLMEERQKRNKDKKGNAPDNPRT